MKTIVKFIKGKKNSKYLKDFFWVIEYNSLLGQIKIESVIITVGRRECNNYFLDEN